MTPLNLQSIVVDRRFISTGDVFPYQFGFKPNGLPDRDYAVVLAVSGANMLIQRLNTDEIHTVSAPSHIEVTGGKKLDAARLNPSLITKGATGYSWRGQANVGMVFAERRPIHYPGALPDETPSVIQHLEEYKGIPGWQRMSYRQIQAFDALRRAGYIRRASYCQWTWKR